jgi:DNA integrity scanning protein DisA with diadenylate cyclase activity
MVRRNDFHYTVFLGETGTAAISMEELLRWFDEERSAFIMDYVDPRIGFSGKVEARLLSPSDMKRALKAFEQYRRYLPYPDNYEHQLRSAFDKPQNPCAYRAELKLA